MHKGISFESALFDGMLLLKEQEADNILVGGTEEMVDTSFTVLTRLGFYRRKPVSNLSLFATPGKGTIGGEGAGFFLLTGKESPDNHAVLTGLTTFYKPTDNQHIERRIITFLQQHSLTVNDIDLVITGKNGDVKNDEIYAWLNASLFKNNVTANYKHLSGEYSVASAFSLWLAANIVKKGAIPDAILEDDVNISAPKNILLLNHYQNKYYSLMLVSAV